MNRSVASLAWTAAWIAAQGCADEVTATGRGPVEGQSSACIAEAERDGSDGAPRRLHVGSTLMGRACARRTEIFVLDAEEYVGDLLSVDIQQLEGSGELDARVVAPASGLRFPSQAPEGAAQRNISFVASETRHALTVDLVDLPMGSSPGRSYAVTSRHLVRSSGDCCSTGAGPGCADDGVLTCLCQLDNACCAGAYDATCVAEARASCGLTCEAPALNDCCTSGGSPGCSAPDVQRCVCAIDPFCCVGGFDENCVNLANVRCGASCTMRSN